MTFIEIKPVNQNLIVVIGPQSHTLCPALAQKLMRGILFAVKSQLPTMPLALSEVRQRCGKMEVVMVDEAITPHTYPLNAAMTTFLFDLARLMVITQTEETQWRNLMGGYVGTF